jgi:hypothetical protein
VNYRVFRDGGTTPIAIVSTTAYSDFGWRVSSTHSYVVKASMPLVTYRQLRTASSSQTPGADVNAAVKRRLV